MTSDWGHVTGPIRVEWLEDSRHRDMKILEDVFYVDPRGRSWRALKGDVINGVSSGWFWSRLFPRYHGRPRTASAFHDVYCGEKMRASTEVHRMFYECLRCKGVWAVKAWIMWAVVRVFGPRF